MAHRVAKVRLAATLCTAQVKIDGILATQQFLGRAAPIPALVQLVQAEHRLQQEVLVAVMAMSVDVQATLTIQPMLTALMEEEEDRHTLAAVSLRVPSHRFQASFLPTTQTQVDAAPLTLQVWVVLMTKGNCLAPLMRLDTEGMGLATLQILSVRHSGLQTEPMATRY